jgi:hypothetical protein
VTRLIRSVSTYSQRWTRVEAVFTKRDRTVGTVQRSSTSMGFHVSLGGVRLVSSIEVKV